MKISRFNLFLPLLVFLFLFSSCGEYQQVLKSDDFQWKYQKAKEYFDNGDYYKAESLFDELQNYYKGSKLMEDIYYYYAYTEYYLGNYLIAAHQFKTFSETYPANPQAEECLFMNAKCYYEISPVSELEQSYTSQAMDALQLFANSYPQSKRVADSNQMMDELRRKLEVKAFNAAQLYFDMGKYKGASVAFADVLKEYPDTPDAEQITFMILRSDYMYALNSIQERQIERFTIALQSYQDFVKQFPQSNSEKEAQQIYEQIQKDIKNLNTQTNEQDQAQR